MDKTVLHYKLHDGEQSTTKLLHAIEDLQETNTEVQVANKLTDKIQCIDGMDKHIGSTKTVSGYQHVDRNRVL